MADTKKKSKKKVIIIVAVAVIAVLALVITAISKVKKGMQEAMELMAANDDSLYKVEKQDVEQNITTSGTVIGMERDAYVSPVTAKVEDVRVEVGQTVKKGEILLTYDDSELGDNLERVQIQAQTERAAGNESYEAVNEAASRTSAAKKKASELEDDIKKLKKEIKSLTAEVEEYQEDMQASAEQQQKKAAAEAGKQAVASADEAGQSSDGLDTGDTKIIVPASDTEEEEEIEVDEKAYKKAVSNLNKKNESLAKKQASLAEQESIIAANKDAKVSESTKAQISASNRLSDMNINAAQESLDAAKAGLTADHDGIVESVSIIKGAYANETMTLMTVINADKIGIEFSIAKDDLGSISEGQKARVVISGNEYHGTVEFVSRVAESEMSLTGATNSSGGAIKGRILLDDPDDRIFIGVSAKVYIFVGKSEQTLAVPYEALNTDIDGDFVYIVNEENLIERKDVTIGLNSDEYYEITDGLSEGDSVITEVTSDMKPGDSYAGTYGMGTATVE